MLSQIDKHLETLYQWLPKNLNTDDSNLSKEEGPEEPSVQNDVSQLQCNSSQQDQQEPSEWIEGRSILKKYASVTEHRLEPFKKKDKVHSFRSNNKGGSPPMPHTIIDEMNVDESESLQPVTPSDDPKRAKRILRMCKSVLPTMTFIILLILLILGISLFQGHRDAEEVLHSRARHNIEIYDNSGKELLLEILPKQKIRGNSERIDSPYTAFEELPEHLIEALVFSEDRTFFDQRWGLDWRSIPRVIKHKIRHGEWIGGSTLTQQLIKNTKFKNWMLDGEHDPSRKWHRKWREYFAAPFVKRWLSNQEILERYFNCVYWGTGTSQIYGIKAASRNYFRKEPAQLTPLESLVLVSILNAPVDKNPRVEDSWEPLQKEIKGQLQDMKATGTYEQFDYIPENWKFSFDSRDVSDPYVLVVCQKARPIAHKIARTSLDLDFDKLWKHGIYKTRTTLEAAALEITENTLQSMLAQRPVEQRHEINAAMLVMNIWTGSILALSKVGQGEPFFGEPFIQPGSLLKPFGIVALLENSDISGITETVPNDPTYRVRYDENAYPWTVKNASGQRYGSNGTMTLHDVLVYSCNAPYIRSVYEEVGFDAIIPQLEYFGFPNLNPKTPACLLGTESIRLIDLAKAYTLLGRANGFNRNPTRIQPWLIQEHYGNFDSLMVPPIEPEILRGGKQTRDAIRSVLPALKQVAIKGTASGSGIPEGAYVKTGTSSNFGHGSCVAIFNNILVVAWVQPGNGIQTGRSSFSGGTIPAQMIGRTLAALEKHPETMTLFY